MVRSGDVVNEFEGDDWCIVVDCNGIFDDDDELVKRGRVKRRSVVTKSRSEWERWKLDEVGDNGRVKLIMLGKEK